MQARAGRRATVPTPDLLISCRYDCLAAGGLAAGVLPTAAMTNECGEEAGIPAALAARAKPASCVSYTAFNEDGWGLKPDRLFCFDLEVRWAEEEAMYARVAESLTRVETELRSRVTRKPRRCPSPQFSTVRRPSRLRPSVDSPAVGSAEAAPLFVKFFQLFDR